MARRDFLSERSRSIELSGIRSFYERAQHVKDAIRLELGEPDFDTPVLIKQAACNALEEGYTHYTSSAGLLELRRAIAKKLRAENSITADPESEIVVTSGACAAVNLVILATVSNGDEVLLPSPGWPHYQPCVRLAGGKPVYYPLLEKNRFNIDAEMLADKITRRTKLIFVNSPNNPTGAVLNRVALEKIAEIARSHNLLVIADEVYEKLVYEDTHHSMASLDGMKDLTVTINSMSKTYAMTGWRVGYASGPREIISEMVKLNLFVNTCANSVGQRASLAALTGPQDIVAQMVHEYRKRRDYIVKRLNEIEGISCLKPPGSFYVFPNVSSFHMPSEDLALYLLEKARVAMVPGSAFGESGEGYIRISYANSLENIEEAMRRIEKALKNLHGQR